MTSSPSLTRQTAEGRVALSVERMGAASGVRRVAESGSARLRFPTTRDGVPEAVLINTAGGIAAGDRFETSLDLGPASALVATTSAAEKVYRSDGATSGVATHLTLSAGARLDWLPQETILFDRARLARRLEVEVDPDATALLFEAVVFGRAARGEQVASGFYEERWRVRRAGRLVYADTLRLDGPVAALLDRPAIAAGRRALATLLYVAPEAGARLDEVRDLLAGSASECAASAWSGLLAVRWLAHDIETLRRDTARFIVAFRGHSMPRVWTF